DPAHGVIWGGASDFFNPPLAVITGTAVSTIPVGPPDAFFSGPIREIGVDPERGYLYVLGSAQLAVFSLTTPLTASLWLTTVGQVYPPQALTVQPTNGLAYVGSKVGASGALWIFQGPTLVTNRTMAGVPIALAADPETGWVYAALSGTRQVVGISGTDLAFTVTLPFEPRRIWISPRSHLAYVAGDVQVAALYGPSVRRVLTTGILPRDMVFDPTAGLAILSHEGDNRLVWIEERILDRRIWLPLVLKGP
ncbi:MAG: YncE family protein, partial [Thermoflexus sp.]